MPPDTLPLLLLTRPEPASRRFAAQAAHLGLPVIVAPVLRIVAVAPLVMGIGLGAAALSQVDGASPEAALTLGRAAGLKSLEPVVMERLAKPER